MLVITGKHTVKDCFSKKNPILIVFIFPWLTEPWHLSKELNNHKHYVILHRIFFLKKQTLIYWYMGCEHTTLQDFVKNFY